MTAIRTRLLVWLLSAVALGAVLGAAVTYRNVLQELEAQYDYQLREMALSLRDQGSVSPEEAAAIADERMDFVVQIWSSDGARIYASPAPSNFPRRAILGFADLDAGGTSWRVFSVAARDRVIEVGQPMEVRRDLAAEAALRSVLPTLAIAPLLAGLIWWTVGASLAPVRRVVSEVQQRDASALEPLQESGAPAEIVPLVQSINALLARLRTSFSAQRAFVADAAHELRSPLTALKLQLGLLARANSAEARGEALGVLGEGIERATRLVEQLLTLARNEPGAADADLEMLDLFEVARLALTDVVALAAERGIELSLDAAVPIAVHGDQASLRILVRNLVDNAVRYTPRDGWVGVALHDHGYGAVVTVDDSGPGIPEAERRRVFDRFYRRSVGADAAAASGSGLGLAIVRAIADLHHARVLLEQSPRSGLRVQVAFPGVIRADERVLKRKDNNQHA